jgi:hypothetical protein
MSHTEHWFVEDTTYKVNFPENTMPRSIDVKNHHI